MWTNQRSRGYLEVARLVFLLQAHSVFGQSFQSMFEKSDPIANQILTSQHNVDAFIDIKTSLNQTVINVIGSEKEEKSIVCQTSDLVYNISNEFLVGNPGNTVFWDSGAGALFVADKFVQISSDQGNFTLNEIYNIPKAVALRGTPAEVDDFSNFSFFRVNPVPNQNEFLFESQFVVAGNGRFNVYNERLNNSMTFRQPNAGNNSANIVFVSPSAKNQFWIGFFDVQSVILTMHLVSASNVRENKAQIYLNQFYTASDAQKERISFTMLYISEQNIWLLVMVTKSLGMMRFVFSETRE